MTLEDAIDTMFVEKDVPDEEIDLIDDEKLETANRMAFRSLEAMSHLKNISRLPLTDDDLAGSIQGWVNIIESEI